MLYHGSKTEIRGYLEPRTTYELRPLVYATDDYLYALVRSGAFNNEEFLVREEYEGYKFSLAEIVPNAFDRLFNRPGFIYILDDEDLEYNHESEFISDSKVKIKGTIYIPNIWDELQNYLERLELIYYENSDDYWKTVKGGKEGYLARKVEGLKAIKKAKGSV